MPSNAAWYRSAYCRNVIDMHITDQDARFLSEFNPDTYVEMLKKAGVQSTVLYAHSHVGLCYYPTKIGKMHPGIHGHDILGEVIALCRQAGISVVVYYSLIFDAWAYQTHPDWRIVDAAGRPAAENSRYGVCCPNSPYREYIRAIVAELCSSYDFDGIRFDMTFWPQVCFCRYCQDRFEREVGGDLPTVIDWEDPHWVAFQRLRERWLADFAGIATGTARKFKPGASVEHQSSTYPFPWQFGVSTLLAGHNDFLQGDFYGDALQGSFVRKLISNLSPNRPAGFETSVTTELTDVTALKSEELLTCKASAALADGTAFIMIDSIDPKGTLNPITYERMGRVFDFMKPFQPFLGGQPVQDVAVYFSTESKYNPADKGKPVDDPHLSPDMPHLQAVLGACKALLDRHILFGVLTRRNLDTLSKYKAILLPNVLMMDQEEVEAFREYVRLGGCLYASGYTSLQTSAGIPQDDFMLADVFGVSYQGETTEHFTYIAPTAETEQIFTGYSYPYPVALYNSQIKITAHEADQILGEQVLPYTDPADPHHFASIHNNPPGRWTGSPAIVSNQYGQGRCIYAAADLERHEHARTIFTNLLTRLAGPFRLDTNAPRPVEITLFQQPENRRYILSLVNFQKELPNIPVEGIHIRLEGIEQIHQVKLLPANEPVAFHPLDGAVDFSVPCLETFRMFSIEY
ncbi:MAG: beta-galactosidase trimerization domain-containing protein [Omnitrophica WOR_2 bacterium]